MTDKLHCLTHQHNPQTKIWKADGTVKFPPKSKHFDCEVCEIDNIYELSKFLTELETQSKSCLIRGCYVGDEKAAKIDLEYQKGKVRRIKSLFNDQALHTIMIEVDNFIPFDGDPTTDPIPCINEYIADSLPACFHKASYHWQLSSSAGKKGKEHLLKVHIWFWLKTAYTSEQLKIWATAINLESDHSVFNPVQIHFTANPEFEDGVDNPVKQRSGFVQVTSDDVDLIIDQNSLSPADGVTKLTRQQMIMDAIEHDPIAIHLQENGYVKSLGQLGQLYIECPFKDGHSVESTETSTCYFPANTGGYKYGAIHCFHNSCSHRTQQDFLEKIGCEVNAVYSKQDQMGISESLVQRKFTINGEISLKRYENEWYLFNGKHYDERDDETIRCQTWPFLNKSLKQTDKGVAPFNPNQSDISGVLDALKAVVRFENLKQNSWLGGDNISDCVSMNNGILDISSRALIPHSPRFFTLNSLPFDYIDTDKPKLFLDFLNQAFADDEESIQTLQEFFGYCITPLTYLQKMFMLLGPTRSGKGTIARVIENMLGTANVSGGSFSSLSSNFGLQPLRGKLLGIFPDVRVSGRSDVQAIVEKLLCISGEDNVIVDQKYKTPWSGLITARLLLISNELPQLLDASNALVGRFIFLETRKSYFGKEDSSLNKRLLSELPQIFNWALDGRERLLKRGHFLQPQSAAHVISDMKRLGNPIAAFIEDMCKIGGNLEIEKAVLFDYYVRWCNDNGYKFPKNMAVFARDLLSGQDGISPSKKSINGDRIPYFSGICLREEEKNELEI